jgi:hypothetical protein
MPFQDHNAPFPIHRNEGFLEVKKDAIKRPQLKVRELLGQFGFNDRDPRPTVCTAPVEGVVQDDGI